jgi:RNA polymerase sigma-70 factor (ECF subfamily)
LRPEVDQKLSRLMQRAQDGERQAYAELLTEVATHVRSYLRRRIPSATTREDVVQEVLLAMHRNRHTYDPGRSFAPWMYAIARNRMLDQLKRQRRLRRHEECDEWAIARAAQPARAEGMPSMLAQALASLNQRQRAFVDVAVDVRRR